MTIVCTFVRHGETKNNFAKIVQSRTDGELSEKGIWMSQALGEHLKDEQFTHFFSSDLKRVRDTTKHFASKLKGPVPEIQFTPLLRERDFGDWEFTTEAFVNEKIAEQGIPFHKGHKCEVVNGETYRECVERTGKFFSKILKLVDVAESKENPSENIVAFSHGFYINTLLEYFLENPDEFQLVNFSPSLWEKFVESPNTARTRFTIKTEPSSTSSTDSGEQKKKPKRIITFTNFFDVQHLKVKSTDS